MTSDQQKHDVFQAIADPTRRSILRLLAGNDMSIKAIKDFFPLSRTAVNKHLHILVNAEVIRSKKVGRETKYQLTPAPLAELRQWLVFFDGYWNDNLANLRKVVESGHE